MDSFITDNDFLRSMYTILEADQVWGDQINEVTVEMNKFNYQVFKHRNNYGGGLTNMNYNQKKKFVRIHPGPKELPKFQISVAHAEVIPIEQVREEVWNCIENVTYWWQTDRVGASLQGQVKAGNMYNSSSNILPNCEIEINGGPIPHVLIALYFAYCSFKKYKKEVEITLEHYGAKDYHPHDLIEPNVPINETIATDAYKKIYSALRKKSTFHIIRLAEFFKKQFNPKICDLQVGVGCTLSTCALDGKEKYFCVVNSKPLPWDMNKLQKQPFLKPSEQTTKQSADIASNDQSLSNFVVLKKGDSHMYSTYNGLLPVNTHPVTFKTKSDLWTEIPSLNRNHNYRMVPVKIQQYDVNCRYARVGISKTATDNASTIKLQLSSGHLNLLKHQVNCLTLLLLYLFDYK